MNSPVQPLLEIRNLRTSFFTEAGVVPAVDGVSLCVPPGKIVALVGESGCGKSVTALSIMRLIPQLPGKITGGQVLLTESPPVDVHTQDTECHAQAEGAGMPDLSNAQHGSTALGHGTRPVDLLQLTDQQMRRIRGGRIAMIFQEPMTSLNPVFSVGEQIVEAIELHQPLRGKDARGRAVEMLHRVGIPDPRRRVHDYPHQLSGGMQQRVMIAMALSCQPALLIADEPTTALDVTVQLQILNLLQDIRATTGMSVLLITHDLGVVAQIADYVYVMYAGRIVEHAPARDLLANPLHPYTQGLLRCVPRLSGRRERRLEVIPGSVPDPTDPRSGCRFHPRCSLATERARDSGRRIVTATSHVPGRVLRRCVETYSEEPSGDPELRELQPGHFVACWEAEASTEIDVGGRHP